MAELCESTAQDHVHLPAPPLPPPPTTIRRPRVREVSSRFMSSLTSTPSSSSSLSSNDPLHLSTSLKSPIPKHQHHHQHQIHGSLTPYPNFYPSESNQSRQRSTSAQKTRRTLDLSKPEPEPNPNPEPLRSANENRLPDTPIQLRQNCNKPSPSISTFIAASSLLRKQRSLKSSKENQIQIPKTYSRPDTPNLNYPERIVSSRLKSISHRSAASKLLHSNLSSSRENSPSRENSDLRSSMPDVDMLPSVSGRGLTTGVDGSKFSSSISSSTSSFRSLSCDQSMFNSIKGSERLVGNNNNNLSRPPVPPACVKINGDVKKGKRVSSHQEDVNSLRLLYNRFLQWRFANAKAEASLQAQQREAERTVYSIGVKISELYDSVKQKRMELEFLRRRKMLSTILDAQIVCLEEWSNSVEEEYSASLSETILALSNSSIRLPISGSVKADVKDVGEALNSAVRVMESIFIHVQNFTPKAEEAEVLVSELARVSGGERGLIEEYGELLSKRYASQVEECSLRGQLIQLQSITNTNSNVELTNHNHNIYSLL